MRLSWGGPGHKYFIRHAADFKERLMFLVEENDSRRWCYHKHEIKYPGRYHSYRPINRRRRYHR